MIKPNEKKFAKIFESETYGQILVKQDQSEPEIEIAVYPDGFGIVAVTMSHDDFNVSDSVFDNIDIDFAEGIAKSIFETISEI